MTKGQEGQAGEAAGAVTAADRRWLGRTLQLARRGRYRVYPNPMVGAVIVRAGRSIAEGYHRRVGGPHGEVDALARLGRHAARGATLYVNLEPCSHHGRTPPCVDAVIAAGVARVVCCHRDPNPQVAGSGIAKLRRAGIEVAEGGPVTAAAELNLGFLVPRVLGRPAVTVKWAMSLDGKIATAGGASQWISSPAGRRWALDLRELHAAILVGSGTVIADDPRLDRRLGRAEGPIVRVVLDRRLRTPVTAAMFSSPGPVWIYTERRGSRHRERLRRAGASVLTLDAVTPAAVLSDLAQRGVETVLVEGGAEILGAFVNAGLFDRVAVCCAPLLIGGRRAPGPLGGEGSADLGLAPRVEEWRTRKRGRDLIVEGVRAGCLPDLLPSVVA